MLLDPLEEQFDLPAATVELVIVIAGSAKLLVKNTSVLPSSVLNRMRRSASG